MGLSMPNDGLALTPPMGWNSWNRFACDINEELIREIADSMFERKIRDAGYQYVVLDDGWSASERDYHGNLISDPNKFPSGIKALADYIHSKDLKLGIYLDAGRKTCTAQTPGSFGYEARDAQRIAEWDVDYVKIDWCNAEGLDQKTQYTVFSDTLRKTRRPIVFSICEWGTSRPWLWASRVGHLWRTTGDIQDNWKSMLTLLDINAELWPYAGPGHWNDPDMLEVGNGGMSAVEYKSHFILWCMMAAPLMAGNDLRTMSESTRAILTAPEVIAVDQDPLGIQGKRLWRDHNTELWVKPLAEPGAAAVALFNRGDKKASIAFEWPEIGFETRNASVRNLWTRVDFGVFSQGFAASVAPHDTLIFKVSER